MVAWSMAWVCGRSLAWNVGSYRAGTWMSFSYECGDLSGTVLCDWPIPRSGGTNQVGECVCVCVCVVEDDQMQQ
jgi:hypothetical protein